MTAWPRGWEKEANWLRKESMCVIGAVRLHQSFQQNTRFELRHQCARREHRNKLYEKQCIQIQATGKLGPPIQYGYISSSESVITSLLLL
jgi:hypothetical protein